MAGSGFNFDELVLEANNRWLKPAEVFSILQNHENLQITPVPPEKPPSGSLFLFNKRVLRFFRKDGHRWQRKKDGRSGGEGHERLKVGNVEALNCYYAHGEQNPKFQRRIYWILDPAYKHIVLVHYRDISQGKQNAQFENYEPYSSSGSMVNRSFVVTNSYGINQSSATVEEDSNSSLLEISHSLSLNDFELLYNPMGYSPGVNNIPDGSSSFNEMPDDSNTGLLHRQSSSNTGPWHEVDGWKDVVDGYGSSMHANCIQKCFDNTDSVRIPQQVADFGYPISWPAINIHATNPDQSGTSFDQNQRGIYREDNTSLTISPRQNFRITCLSPDWGYTDENTKVIITGSFLCDPSVCELMCMFGDIEVPVQIIQDGVLCCHAPPHLPGKVTLCITMGNRESCSEVRDFEYRVKHTSKNIDELLLLVSFAKMLLSDKSRCSVGSPDFLEKDKASEDLWNEVMGGLLMGNLTSNLTIDWLLQELLKDKFHQWLSSKLTNADCVLSRNEQVVIHRVSGLGFEWALRPILDAGVAVDFRDNDGLTALHWAARFGREKMVAALIASGASAGAVTNPTKEDRTGQSPAAIAAMYGHKGLAGYLSEVALTTHLSSLTLEESKSSEAEQVEAEGAFGFMYETGTTTNEDQLSLKHTLAAVRNATQAAARIQAAFRVHSFRKRQQREAAATAAAAAAAGGGGDEFGILSDYSAAALTIQKKYRGWKGRKDFLAFRQKVVKIQAHVRGYRARKEFMVGWATGILEKIILRWHRHRIGLRGFNLEVDQCEGEEILKVFRKQKVDAAIDEAVSRVLSMVECPEARQQYCRILETYRQAKAKLQSAGNEAKASHDGMYQLFA